MVSQERLILSVVLPAYLEEENLRLLLPRLKNTLNQLRCAYEIVIVDTSTKMDNTASVCETIGARYVQRQPSNTFGDAVRSGIKAANGEFVLFMDADGSHTPEFIPDLFRFRNEADVVIASRYVRGGHTENTPSLILMSKILNLTYSLTLGIKCKDVSNSFKIYRAAQLKEFELTCQNFDIVEEILFKLTVLNKKLVIKEVPFVFKKRMFGETKRNLVLFMATYLLTMLRLRFSRVRRLPSVQRD